MYARSTDSFIRGEVLCLREQGFEVFTYSIRKPSDSEATNDIIRAEQARTCYLFSKGKLSLFLDVCRTFSRHPLRSLGALLLSLRIAVPGFFGTLLSVIYWFEALVLSAEMQRARIQHLHNHIGQNSAVVALLVSHMTGIPFSLTIHGPVEFDQPEALVLGEKVSRSAFTVAISDYGRSQLMRWTPIDMWDRIKVVRCGVDRQFLSGEIVSPSSENRFVCVARLSEQKGLPVLIAAAKQLRDAGHEFVIEIVGDGPFHSTLEREIKRQELGDCVHLLGTLSPELVRERILASRATVLPSFAEGLPVVIMESLALARPVIATHIAGIPELVRPGENGWLVPAGSSRQLADAIQQAIETSLPELERMGRNGAEIASVEHDQVLQAEKLGALFRKAGESINR